MVFQSQVLHKPERSGHKTECTIVYFYESTNVRGRTLVKNFADFPIPVPDGSCDCSRPDTPDSAGSPERAVRSFPLEKGAFQHIEGPVNQLEWLADIALSCSIPLPKPPPPPKILPKTLISAPSARKLPKLAPLKTPRITDGPVLLKSLADVAQRPKEGRHEFTFLRYRDSSTLRLGMAENIDADVPMKRKRRLIVIPAASLKTTVDKALCCQRKFNSQSKSDSRAKGGKTRSLIGRFFGARDPPPVYRDPTQVVRDAAETLFVLLRTSPPTRPALLHKPYAELITAVLAYRASRPEDPLDLTTVVEGQKTSKTDIAALHDAMGDSAAPSDPLGYLSKLLVALTTSPRGSYPHPAELELAIRVHADMTQVFSCEPSWEDTLCIVRAYALLRRPRDALGLASTMKPPPPSDAWAPIACAFVLSSPSTAGDELRIMMRTMAACGVEPPPGAWVALVCSIRPEEVKPVLKALPEGTRKGAEVWAAALGVLGRRKEGEEVAKEVRKRAGLNTRAWAALLVYAGSEIGYKRVEGVLKEFEEMGGVPDVLILRALLSTLPPAERTPHRLRRLENELGVAADEDAWGLIVGATTEGVTGVWEAARESGVNLTSRTLDRVVGREDIPVVERLKVYKDVNDAWPVGREAKREEAEIEGGVDAWMRREDAWNGALAVWDQMKRPGSGGGWDKASVSIIIDALGWAGRDALPRARQLWDGLRRRHGLRLNTNNYTSWVEALCRMGEFEEAERVVYVDMREGGNPRTRPDEKTLRTLVSFAWRPILSICWLTPAESHHEADDISTIKILSVSVSVLQSTTRRFPSHFPPTKMDPFSGATAGSLFAPPPRPYLPARSSSTSLLAAQSASRHDSRSPMPARPDAADDPFFSMSSMTTSHPAMPHLSHPVPAAPIPHTSVPFAPTELAVLQRWSQVYHSHRARCPVGPPPGMPAAVYDIFERLGGATPFTAPTGDYAAQQQQTSAPATAEEAEAFRPEAWSSGTMGADGQPTPGLYRSPEGEASAPSSSSPAQTLRSSGSGGTRPHVYSGVGGVRIGSSPSYGALDQHMRALELKRGAKRNSSSLGRNKTNRVVSAPTKGLGGDKKGSSPLVGMKGSSPLMTRHSSPLVGFGSGAEGYDPQSLFMATAGGDATYQAQAAPYAFSANLRAAPGLANSQSFMDIQNVSQGQDGEEDAAPGSQSTQTTLDENEKTTPAPAPAAATAAPKEKSKSRSSASVPDRTDPNTMPDRNDPNVTIIEDPASLRGMRYEDFEPHMFIGRSALGTEYPRSLEPGAGHERIRCLLCKCG
ncbi:hypothetical protein FRC07_008536, partial [Ceratobasidium sp. 392]